MTAGYSGRPLAAKLGIKADHRVLILGGPPELLGDTGPLGDTVPRGDTGLLGDTAPSALPRGVVLHRRAGHGRYDVAVVFCPDAATLRRRFGSTGARLVERGALWICWPKRASGVPTDLGENQVREHGLAVVERSAGDAPPRRWVDVKVAAIDATWSGLMFVRRLPATQ